MIFADTSFWIAWSSPEDGHHEAADLALASRSLSRLVVSNHVLGETWTFLRRRGGHHKAEAVRGFINGSSRIEVVRVSQEQEEAAWRWLAKHDERAYSFVDATSFAVMRSLKIREALAFDGDFTAAGFTELRA